MENAQYVNKDLEGKIALVTGGTQGIGKAIADRLARAGARVIVTARNRPGDMEIKHHFIAADFSEVTNVARMSVEINEQFGGVDILVNNMGANIYPGGGYGTLTDEHWDQACR
ncbi:short chain dehydrogenase [Pedobacter hartonius]|uniref:Short chain dehydrogenase n=1 Tax=Pedobacter hartonius TaxID=425514 RepID=A0A1H4BAW2_9SPHI|nr:SDR family NAD(P)-dependent oxidoreductase [Pedobacter hartonius]SEA45271.1 short chain dehydrogenase [Pedobacter hartonius]